MSAIDVMYEGEGGPWLVARAAQQAAVTFVEYSDEHLDRAAELAPLRHPTEIRSREFIGRSVEHLPGLLADALPDSWGRLVLRRDMRQHGREQPGTLEMLTWLGRRTMGALTFRPVDGVQVIDEVLVDLDRMQAEMLRHLSGRDAYDIPADALMRAAGSGAGGARPKIAAAVTTDGTLIADNGLLPDGATPWLIKFHSSQDSPFLSAIEATYLQMAAEMGITVCEHRLLPGSSDTQYLAVRRFDRMPTPQQPQRIHMSTAAGLLEAYPEYDQHCGYDDVIRLTRRVTGDQRAVTELVRRAVFNVVTHNRDDHARNISYLWSPQAGWCLAPAYDLTYSMGPRPISSATEPGEHYLDIAGKGKDITRADLQTLKKSSGMKASEIDEIVDAALEVTGQWPELAARNGVDDPTIHEVALRLPGLNQG